MRFFDELEGLVTSKIAVIQACLSMIKLETRLAGLSVYPLLLNLCMLLICLMSLWLSGMGILGYVLMQVFNNALIAMGSVFLFNVLLLGTLSLCLSSNFKKMSFSKTRAFLSRDKELAHHEFKKTGDDCTGEA